MVAKKSGVKRPAWPGGGGKDRGGGAGPGKAIKRISAPGKSKGSGISGGSKKTGSAGRGYKGVSPGRPGRSGK